MNPNEIKNPELIKSLIPDSIFPIIQTKTVADPMVQIEYLETKPRFEYGSTIPETEVLHSRKIVELKTYQVAAGWSKQQENDLFKYGIDIKDQLHSVLMNEAKQCLTKDVLKKVSELGTVTLNNTYSPWQRFLYFKLYPFLNKSKWINLTEHKVHKIRSNSPVNTIKKVKNIIDHESNSILIKTQKGQAEFIICDFHIAAILQNDPTFIPMSVGNGSTPYLQTLGKIGNVVIIVDATQSSDSGKIIVGKKCGGIGLLLKDSVELFDMKEHINPEAIKKVLKLRSVVYNTQDSDANFFSTVYLNVDI